MWQSDWLPWGNEDIYGPVHSNFTSSWRRRPPLVFPGYQAEPPYSIYSNHLPPNGRALTFQQHPRNMPQPPIGHDWRSFDGWGIILFNKIII